MKMHKHCEHCLCHKCAKDSNEVGKRVELRVKAVLEDMGFTVRMSTLEEDSQGVDLWVDGVPFQIKTGRSCDGKGAKYHAAKIVVLTKAHDSPLNLPFRIIRTLKSHVSLYGESLTPLLEKAKASIKECP